MANALDNLMALNKAADEAEAKHALSVKELASAQRRVQNRLIDAQNARKAADTARAELDKSLTPATPAKK